MSTKTYKKVISIVQPILDECATFLPETGRRFCVASDTHAEMRAAADRLHGEPYHRVSEEWRNWLRHYDYYTSLPLMGEYKDGSYITIEGLKSFGPVRLTGALDALWERYTYLSQLKNIKGGRVFHESGKTLGYFDLDFQAQRALSLQ